jgi:hypothetical protein
LWHRVRAIKKKSDNLLEELRADVDSAVNAIAGLRPIHFANRDLPWQSLSAIAELDVEKIPAEDHRHSVKGIAVPGSGLPWR